MSAPVYLDQLANVLATAGWSTRARYDEDPARLHVFSAGSPMVGESVRVKAGVGGVPWFISSTGDPIAPCHDLPGAVEELGLRLGAWVRFAVASREVRAADEERRLGWFGRLRVRVGPSRRPVR